MTLEPRDDDRPLSAEENERIRRWSQKAMTVVTLCLSATLLITILAVAALVGVTITAQHDAQRLRTELECRADIASAFDIEEAEILVGVARGLLNIEAGIPLVDVRSELETNVKELEVAAQTRKNAVEICSE